MLDNLKKYNIILASNSPRRRELLSQLGISFNVNVLKGIDETFPMKLSGEAAALHIVSKKSAAYQTLLKDNDLVITADTIVCVDDTILGKPTDVSDAHRMLHLLSGRQHKVVTAVGISTIDRYQEFAVTTEVTFADLSDEIIDYYVKHYHPYDKAGSYGIQEWIGYIGVKSIRGSFFNVIGLPVQRLFEELRSF